jgi:hypothetical protein
MAIARFKDLCLDAVDPVRLGLFWASVLGRTWQAQEGGDGLLTGPTRRHTIWVNQVPEAKTVKHRVHLDIYARDLADLQALGATVVEPRHGTRSTHPLPAGTSLARIRQPSIVPPTGWSALAPQASSGSNGIVMTALSRGPAAMTARKRCEPMTPIVA